MKPFATLTKTLPTLLIVTVLAGAAELGCGLDDGTEDNAITFDGKGTAGGPIRPCAANRFYWQYGGKCLLLVGGSDRDNLFQWANDGTRLRDHLDLLRKSGGNYVRNTMSSREYTVAGYRWDILPYPWKRLGSGKYDLNQWDAQYWSKLKALLNMARDRGIIVQVELWDMWNESGDSNKNAGGWYHSPWNPNNNVNYKWTGSPLLTPGRTPFYNPLHLAPIKGDPLLVPHQRRFVRKLLDVTLPYGNVLYQVDNESGIDTAIGGYWAKFVRNYAKTKGRTVFVTDSRRFHKPAPKVTTNFRDWSNPEIRVPVSNPGIYTFLDISQNCGNSGQTQYENFVWYRSRVRQNTVRPINQTKCYYFNWPTGTSFNQRTEPSLAEAGAKAWRTVFAGAAGIRFHRNTAYQPGKLREGLGLGSDARKHIRSFRMFANAIDIATTAPHNELLTSRASDEAYALAKPGHRYGVFFTGKGDRSVNLDVSMVSGKLELRWLNVSNRSWSSVSTVQGGGTVTLLAPGSGHRVAVLIASGPGGPDAGSHADAGADAGSHADAGVDAGSYADAGADAGSGADGGATPNLIDNSGFENGTTNWGMTSGTSLVGGGHSGNALSITANGAFRQARQIVASVQAGATYEFATWVRTQDLVADGAYQAQAALRWRNAQGRIVGGPTYLYSGQGTSSWSRRKATITAPSGAAGAMVTLYTWSAVKSGIVLFDDVSLQAM